MITVTLAKSEGNRPGALLRLKDQPDGLYRVYDSVGNSLWDTWVYVIGGVQIVLNPGHEPRINDLSYFGVKADPGTEIKLTA